jgi:hypothetical protein
MFWKANSVAMKIWGCGFQVDRAATFINAMPTDCTTRLPFNSKDYHPHSSGVDMLQQDWTQLINWCNPPFDLVGRVLRLIRTQHTRAAVVTPAVSSAWWFQLTHLGCPGIKKILHSGKINQHNAMRWSGETNTMATQRYRIIFFDFTTEDKSAIFPYVSAERLPRATSRSSDPTPFDITYLSLSRDMRPPPT